MQTKLFGVGILILVSSLSLWGQTFGEISGEVRDPSGAGIPGVQVTATNTETNVARNTVTNDAGVYSFPAMVPGFYNVRAEKSGFKSVTRTDIQLQVQQSARLDIEMPIGQVSESVEVSASATLLSTENATVGTVVETKRIVELPLNGRNYLQLVSLAPNVSYGFGSAGQAGSRQGGERAAQNISVGGNRSEFNNFTLDVVDNNDPNLNTYIIQPYIDALQEFKVQTGVYPAEFGREGTQINVSTKPGTNSYHGTLYEFLRNDALDANNYSFTSVRTTKYPFKWNQYGGTFGGPVWIPKLFNGKNKLFFMGNYESFRQRQSSQSLYNLPSSAMRNGDFSELLARGITIYDPNTRATGADGKITATQFAGNLIPSSRMDAISKKFLEFYPAPNLPNSTLIRNFQQSQSAPRNKDQFILRMDFNESANSQWSGRYSWGDENQVNEGLKLNGFKVLTNVEQYMGSNTRVLSPSMVNEFRFGYSRFFNSAGRELAFVRNVVKELAIPGLNAGDPVTWGIPAVAFTRYSGFGDDSEGPYANDNNALQFVDNFSWVRGKHSFRFGGEIRRDAYNQVGNQFARGSFTFDINATRNPALASGGDDFADFLLGQVKRSEAAVQIAEAQFRSTSFAAYIDDVWKVSPKLTLNLGLRYERTPPFEDQTGKLITAAIPLDTMVPKVADLKLHPYWERQGSGDFYEGFNLLWPDIQARRDGHLGNRLVSVDNRNFAPRIGITWNPSPKWVVRSGFGIFFSQDTGNPRFDMARNLAGRTRFESIDPVLYTFENAFASLAGAKATVFRPYAFANLYDRKTPRTMTMLLNVQRELPGNTVLEVGYLGSISHHLESLRAVNEAIPGTTPVLDRTPFAEFGRIQLVDASSNANYNGLSGKLTKRYSNGLTYLASYTWAKSIDNSSSIRTHNGDTLFPQNSNCLRCERALSQFHTASRFVTSLLYDIPVGRGRQKDIQSRALDAVIGGWQIGAIWTYQSGFPLTISANARDSSNIGAGFDRPNAVPGVDPVRPRGEQTTEAFFNKNAYSTQVFGTFGNVGRNTMIGPRIFNVDASLIKDFTIKESMKTQFRWELFNSINHPNWGDPNTNFYSGAFGTIASTRMAMRQMQLALKFIF
ncbi:MAG: TonB-dependent receptor [Bryobacterales bacterium]|nr:TonB-dependent receptor [Bryobacterales bacterium]